MRAIRCSSRAWPSLRSAASVRAYAVPRPCLPGLLRISAGTALFSVAVVGWRVRQPGDAPGQPIGRTLFQLPNLRQPYADSRAFRTGDQRHPLGYRAFAGPDRRTASRRRDLMWRSLLFVPALEDGLPRGACWRGADAIVFDVEEAVPPDRRDEARARLAPTITRFSGTGTLIAVRVTRGDDEARKDIAAAVDAGAGIIVLPRACPAATAQAAALAGPAVRLIPLIEVPRDGIEALAVAEAAPSVAGLGLGVEDHAADMGSSHARLAAS